MKILYSKILPIPMNSKQESIKDAIVKGIISSDRLDIAVGYVSVASLIELDLLVEKYDIQKVRLIIGMYKFSGIPESIYNKASEINEKWTHKNIGKIYFVNNMTYHGKIYVFSHNNEPFKSIIGSANLSVLAPEGQTTRQYELATESTDKNYCLELLEHVDSVIRTSTTLADNLDGFKIAHERISVLDDVESIIDITSTEIKQYNNLEEDLSFSIPIKAPNYENRFSDESKYYAHSNINVCYGKGRLSKASGKISRRNWYEAQITVSKDITSKPGYPKGDPFYLVTDDGYKFIAHSTAANDKQLTAYGISGNDRVFGRWIKGRLATAGYVVPYDNVDDDVNGDGIVTLEMLKKAHMSEMILTKTRTQEFGKVYERLQPTPQNKKGKLDKKHFKMELLDVWTVHFV